jgi:hypothetical protein
MGSHHSSGAGGIPVTGGAFGTSPAAPGTNSLGTALSSNGVSNGPQKGPLLGTNPAIDREEAKVDRMITSICRGCWRGRWLAEHATAESQAAIEALILVAESLLLNCVC